SINYNYDALKGFADRLKKEDNLKVKLEKNYFKIEFNSQEDIDKIISYLNLQ
ncbi:MAG: chromosome partitioning protein ParB, partial [Arcobacter sp.]|nr:chromosome partitioning protein ParB [Arcobacter sp.]